MSLPEHSRIAADAGKPLVNARLPGAAGAAPGSRALTSGAVFSYTHLTLDNIVTLKSGLEVTQNH